jgi:Spy/CpxP family protein refolding chaperone
MYKLLLSGLALVLLGGPLAVAQPADNPPQPKPNVKVPQPPKGPPQDPIGDNLFPPELIVKFADQIGVTEEQRDSGKSLLEKAETRVKEFQRQLEQEVQAMGALVKEDHPDAEKALAQLDKVLAAEREVKRVQIALMISLKNLLTPDQQAQLRELRQKMMAESKRPGDDVPQSLQMKMQQAQQQMKQLKAEGRDLASLQELVQKFEPLMREKKFAEAEAVLDEGLKLLGEAAGKP